MSEPLRREQQALARSAMGMVQRYARRFARHWPKISEEDFRSVGNEAITVAARQFDPTSEFAFGAYAKKRVRGRMTDLATGQIFGQSAVISAMWHAADQMPERSDSERERAYLSDDDAATSRLKLLAQYRERVAEWAIGALLTADPARDPEALLIEQEETVRTKAILNSAVEALDDTQRQTVRRFYHDRATLDAIAEEVGISKRSVQRALLRAIDILRAALAADGIETPPESP